MKKLIICTLLAGFTVFGANAGSSFSKNDVIKSEAAIKQAAINAFGQADGLDFVALVKPQMDKYTNDFLSKTIDPNCFSWGAEVKIGIIKSYSDPSMPIYIRTAIANGKGRELTILASSFGKYAWDVCYDQTTN